MTNLILLTGFLGSGKTTLLQNILKQYGSQKNGLIVNEFGPVNVDGRLLSKQGVQTALLSNGSVFCACLKDKFVDSLIDMSRLGLDNLFIEASGLADPSSMETVLAGIAGETGGVYTYRGSICVVDASRYLDLSQVLTSAESQIEYCSAVILNKTDLADDAALQEIKDQIRSVNDRAAIYPSTYCNVDILNIIKNMGAILKPQARESSNSIRNRAASFIVTDDKDLVSRDALQAFLFEIAPDTYRIKGFVRTSEGTVEVSAAGTNITISEWKEPVEQTELVIISAVGIRIVSTITKSAEHHVQGCLRLQ